jgi:hypothetical protein
MDNGDQNAGKIGKVNQLSTHIKNSEVSCEVLFIQY